MTLGRTDWRRIFLLLTLLMAASALSSSAQTRGDVERAASGMSEDVRALYHRLDYGPIWIVDRKLTTQGADLLRFLDGMGEHGLDPAEYRPPVDLGDGSYLRAGAKMASLDAHALSLELALTQTALIAAEHLLRGRVDPRTMHPGWTVAGRTPTAADALGSALLRGNDIMRELAPPHEEYAHLQDALSRYRQIAARGGWDALPSGRNLRKGDRDDRIRQLRTRLDVTATLEETQFDAAVERAVRKFQRQHGLEPDGIVGPRTIAAFNVPAEDRVRQIELNLERWRWLPASLGRRYALINVAGYYMEVIEDGTPVLEMKVIVGKPSTPTPLFSSQIEQVVLAPYWYVPQSIARNEILPKLANDPDYLERNRIRRLSGGTLRQDPGAGNPMGRLKFIIPNNFGVGLHDTSEPGLFARAECAFSHGCMRLEKPIEMALYVLRDTEWTRKEIERVISQGKQRSISVSDPLPIHVLLWTVWVENDGTVHFRRDVYGHDRSLEDALADRVEVF